MDKIRIKEALAVEGRYDKNTLAQLVDAPIFVTNGFGIFKDPETLALLRAAAERRGLIVLTDSDGGGLVIRNHLKGAIDPAKVKHAYIPDVPGKEKRKAAPGREGKLGVEGMKPEVLLAALKNAGATFLDEEPPVGAAIGRPPEATGNRQQAIGDGGCGLPRQCKRDQRREPGGLSRVVADGCAGSDKPCLLAASHWLAMTNSEPCPITKTDLFELGLSGRPDSKERRRALQKALGLPENLSANALLTALNCLFTRDEFLQIERDSASAGAP